MNLPVNLRGLDGWHPRVQDLNDWTRSCLVSKFVLVIYLYTLAGGLRHFLFSIIYGIILPIDSYFSEVLKPPTSTYTVLWSCIRTFLTNNSGETVELSSSCLFHMALVGWESKFMRLSDAAVQHLSPNVYLSVKDLLWKITFFCQMIDLNEPWISYVKLSEGTKFYSYDVLRIPVTGCSRWTLHFTHWPSTDLGPRGKGLQKFRQWRDESAHVCQKRPLV